MITIVDAKECSVEGFKMQPANITREALARIFPAQEEGAVEVPHVPTAEEKKAWRSVGKALFEKCHTVQMQHKPALDRHAQVGVAEMDLDVTAQHPLIDVVCALNTAVATKVRSAVSQSLPYIIEGAVSAAKAAMFKAGVKLGADSTEAYLLSTMGWSPRGTSGYQDALFSALNATGGYAGFLYHLSDASEDLQAYWGEYRSVSGAPGWASLRPQVTLLGYVTTEGTDAMFHGFVGGFGSFSQLRWQSMRLAAAVKQVTGSDTDAQRAADKFRDVNNYNFTVYPNDYPFGDVYVEHASELDSCMSNNADDYECPKGIHPCDTYSAAWFGAGDNGLALVLACKGADVVGRGILNTQNGQIVRWYGEHKAGLQLKNKFNIEMDSGALDGSWLALVEDDTGFAHPYVDGDYEYGDLCNGTVVLVSPGAFDLQNTGGRTDTVQKQYCCINQEYYSEEDMTYQPENDTWILEGADAHRIALECPVTGEYFRKYDGYTRTIRGEDVEVSYAGLRILQDSGDWQCLSDSIGYIHTDNQDDYGTDVNGDWYHVDDLSYDDVTEESYTHDDYAELLAARDVEEQADDEERTDEAA